MIRADSHDSKTLSKVRRIPKGKPLDLLFIDSDHSYDGVRRDYEMYSPLVKGGIVVFHDIVPGSKELVGGVLIFLIPPGFAHGFQALEDDTLVLCLVTKEYSREHERCVRWDDPEIGVPWPIGENAIVSEKDSRCPPLREAEINFTYS